MAEHALTLVGCQPGTDNRIKRAPGEPRKYDIAKLQAVHHEILRLKAVGVKNTVIAEQLGVTDVMVSYVVNSTLGQTKLKMLSASRDADAVDFNEQIKKMLPKAFKLYDEILDDENASLSLRKSTADTVVKELAGMAAPKRIDARHAHMHMSRDEVEDMKERGKAAALAAGVLVYDE